MDTSAIKFGAMKPSVAVGLSGGVDSSVVALLLRLQGLDVVGMHMTNWDVVDEAGTRTVRHSDAICPDRDFDDAEMVCRNLALSPCQRFNFVREFWTDVFEPFLRSYEQGHTPNPDVFCNRHIKFHALAIAASARRGGIGSNAIATGHYARVCRTKCGQRKTDDQVGHGSDRSGDAVLLLRGVDRLKDQSYFLSCVDAGQLSNVMFPLGSLKKAEVRALARAANLPTAGSSFCFRPLVIFMRLLTVTFSRLQKSATLMEFVAWVASSALATLCITISNNLRAGLSGTKIMFGSAALR